MPVYLRNLMLLSLVTSLLAFAGCASNTPDTTPEEVPETTEDTFGEPDDNTGIPSEEGDDSSDGGSY